MKPGLSKKQKKNLIRICVALAVFAAVFISDKALSLATVTGEKFCWLLPFSLYFAVYVLIGYDVLFKAARNILRGQILDENFLMAIATLGAFALGICTGVMGLDVEGFDEACAVLLFYQVGEFFQSYATGKSRKSISSLMDIRPDYANLMRDGELVKTEPENVSVGDVILINPGEKVPLDGIIINGSTTLDTKALTGESLPREVETGSDIVSGCVNLTSQIKVKVTKPFYDSAVSKILELVENASSRKSNSENFITKFSKFYTPTVVIAAVLLAVVPALFTGEWLTWIYRGLSFLVVSCPCALVVSVPLAFFAGLGAASKHGILVKGSNYLEMLGKANIFVFDKTGTLTKGNFAVAEILPTDRRDEILKLAAIAEKDSNHPIARSVTACYGGEIEEGYTLTNLAGLGVKAVRGDDAIYCGNEKLMKEFGVNFKEHIGAGTTVYVARGGEFVGSLLISDEIKHGAKETVRELSSLGCKTVMLTGDNETVAESVSRQIGLTSYRASLLPQNKVEEVEKMLAAKKSKDLLCFVGDGINDAPVLMRSDIGIAMGGVGSDAAIEASDVVLMRDELDGIPLAKRIAKKTMAIVFENIILSLLVKLVIMVLSALGITSMWLAVIGDVGVAIVAILNSMRVGAGRFEKERKTKIP